MIGETTESPHAWSQERRGAGAPDSTFLVPRLSRLYEVEVAGQPAGAASSGLFVTAGAGAPSTTWVASAVVESTDDGEPSSAVGAAFGFGAGGVQGLSGWTTPA
jgi:hypothetical protein